MIDHSLYPDVAHPDDLPDVLETDEDRADYVLRVCGAWDFDIYPEPETFATLREWREVFDRFPLAHSPAFHEFRRRFGWPAVPVVGGETARMTYEALDRAEGREPDECLRWV